jgi:poly(A) polymerase
VSQLDPDAVRALQRLHSRGFEAYLVGGCVRDLLLGKKPKDYDIATSARPQQVKRTFPYNCRIIGRRFKLAHLHFHGNTKILEVSTFRRSPQTEDPDSGDLLITQDNEFGNAEQDALRRDFTVNALLLDPLEDRILDYADGLSDIRSRIIRTIGDPRVRFREDPVRILRAAKFAGRLDLHIDPETHAAMAEASPDLVRAAPPRVLEEVLRLLRSGHSLESFQLLRDVGALRVILPLLSDHLGSASQQTRVAFWRTLEALDLRIQHGYTPANAVLLGALFAGAVLEETGQAGDRSSTSVAEDLLAPFCQMLRLPRRDAGCLKRACGVQPRFEQLDEAKRFKVQGFVRGAYFLEALDLFELRASALGIDTGLVRRWRELAADFGARRECTVLGRDPQREFQPNAQRRSAFLQQAAAGGAAATEPPAEGEQQPGEPMAAGEFREEGAGDEDRGGRRRRRRRRRRGHRDEGFEGAQVPGSAEGADESLESAPFEGDREAPAGEADPAEGPHDGQDLPEGESREPRDATGGDDDRGGRRRRRRRRRRRGHGDDQPFPHAEAPAPHGEAVFHEDRGAHEGQGEGARPQRDPNAPQGQGPRRHEGQQGQGRQGQGQRDQGQQGQGPRRDRDRDRGGRRDRRDRRGRRDGGNRDVDVVPRHVDRRGKVDVIEPPPLDLSAFDVELDPKRVPTFGSIVEGQRKKKRTRLPEEGMDDYRPPPAPGVLPGLDAPPPPPPSTEPDDSFGDW